MDVYGRAQGLLYGFAFGNLGSVRGVEMGKYDFIVQELEGLKEQGLYNIIRTIESPVDAWTVVDGKRVLNMCSNNYLGFANDERLKAAALKAIEEYGVGPAAVRSIAGTMSLHEELERKLSEFKHTEDAVSFQSGFCANLATIPALMGKEGVIFTCLLYTSPSPRD